MTPAEARTVVEGCKYPRGRFKFRSLNEDWYGPGMWALTFELRSRDVYDRSKWALLQWHMKLSEVNIHYMNKAALEGLILSTVRNVVDHEMREWFTSGGERVFNPHKPEITLQLAKETVKGVVPNSSTSMELARH